MHETASNLKSEGGAVLVVDDSPTIRSYMRWHLGKAGFAVREACDGVAALQCLSESPFDVVVTDLVMPQLDGLGLLESIKARGLATEVVILTGSRARDVDSAIRALRLGAHDFVTKPPSSPEAVVLTVERALEKKRLREANLRLMEELEALSRTDALTGIANRRAFDSMLDAETVRARCFGLPLSLALIDLDHFKRVNDTHGHPVGDQMLRTVAGRLRLGVRVSDGLFRYGGEEFAILLPHTDRQEAAGLVGRLLRVIAATPIPAGELRLPVTASAGVSSLQGPGADPLGLVAEADAALYHAKAAGRARVEVHCDPPAVHPFLRPATTSV